jgi:hypothetical protein
MAPRIDSYGTLPVTKHEIEPLNVRESSESSEKSDDSRPTGNSRKQMIGYGTIPFLVALALAIYYFGSKKGVIDDNYPHGAGLSAESLISPEEMGFATTKRAEEQSPGMAWGSKLLESGKPIPTNIWYLVSVVTPSSGIRKLRGVS